MHRLGERLARFLATTPTEMAMAASADDTYETTNSGSEVDSARSRGELGNALTYAGIGGAVVLGGVGAASLVLGLKKKRGEAQGEARLQAAPLWGRDQLGVTVGGRF